MKNLRTAIVTTIVALFALISASCEGASNVEPSREYSQSPSYEELAQTKVSEEPSSLDRGASDWFDFDFDWDFPYEILFDLLHIHVDSGNNTLALGTILEKNETSGIVTIPTGDALLVQSSASEMGFVKYGLKDIPDGEIIRGIRVNGYAGPDADSGLFIGVSDYGNGSYQWYGPFTNGEDWEVYNAFMDTTNDEDKAYIVFATYGGDAALISEIQVQIDEPLSFEMPELVEEFEIFEWDPWFVDPIDPGLFENLPEIHELPAI